MDWKKMKYVLAVHQESTEHRFWLCWPEMVRSGFHLSGKGGRLPGLHVLVPEAQWIPNSAWLRRSRWSLRPWEPHQKFSLVELRQEDAYLHKNYIMLREGTPALVILRDRNSGFTQFSWTFQAGDLVLILASTARAACPCRNSFFFLIFFS